MTLVLNTERSQLRDVLNLLATAQKEVNIVINIQGAKQAPTTPDHDLLGENAVEEKVKESIEPQERQSEIDEPQLVESNKDIFDLTTEDLELLEQEIQDPSFP